MLKVIVFPAQLFRLVHALTPLEEHKSFLEKVKFGEKLCGISTDESFKKSASFIREEEEPKSTSGSFHKLCDVQKRAKC